MPRRSKGARLTLRKAVTDPKTGAVIENAVWVIRDGTKSRRTGCAPGEVERAEQALATYIQARHQPDRARDRDPDHIEIADVLSIYIDDVVDKVDRRLAQLREDSERYRQRVGARWAQPSSFWS